MKKTIFAIITSLLISMAVFAQTDTPTPTFTPTPVLVYEGVYEAENFVTPFFDLIGTFTTGNTLGRDRLSFGVMGDYVEFATDSEWIVIERYTDTATNYFRLCYALSALDTFNCFSDVSNVSSVAQYQTMAFKNPYYPLPIFWRIENRGNLFTDTAFIVDKIYLFQGSQVQPTPQDPVIMFVPYLVTPETTQESYVDYIDATDDTGQAVVYRYDRTITPDNGLLVSFGVAIMSILLVIVGIMLWKD